MTQWYVASLKPGATRQAQPRRGLLEERQEEARFERAFRDAGVEFYLPRMRKETIHNRTKKIITRRYALFTGYVFLAVIEPGDWGKVASCEWIGRPLGFNGKPFPIATPVIDSFRDAEEAMLFDDTREARIRRKQEGRTARETALMHFPAGAVVDVTHGPFAGFHGLVRDVTGKGLVRVAIEIFGRLSPVELPAGYIRRAA